MKLGIIAAMPAEINLVQQAMHIQDTQRHGKRKYLLGQFMGVDCVCVLARCGKVSAAATATSLIERYQVDAIIFTGVAGGVAAKLNIGDIVIGDVLIQHDLDARPIFPRFEVPLLNMTHFLVESRLLRCAEQACQAYIADHDIPDNLLTEFAITQPECYVGTIASGDQFIHDHTQIEELHLAIPNLLAVEMEGAAVAQVCYEYDMPLVVIRVISDKANNEAHIDLLKFIDRIASHYTLGILRRLVAALPD